MWRKVEKMQRIKKQGSGQAPLFFLFLEKLIFQNDECIRHGDAFSLRVDEDRVDVELL